MPGTLYRGRDLALVFSTVASLPTRADFPILRDEGFQHFHILVIYYKAFVSAKAAVFRT
jgi:hypothetical protein